MKQLPTLLNMPIQASVGGFYPGDILVVLISFLILLLLVKKFAWGPLLNMMQKREEYVVNELEEAEKNRKHAEELAKQAEQRLGETRKEAQEMMENSRTLAAKQEQEIIEAAKEEAKRLKQSAQADIKHEKESAIQELQDQVSSLSVMIASKVIEKELTEDGQKDLIDEYVKQLGEDHA